MRFEEVHNPNDVAVFAECYDDTGTVLARMTVQPGEKATIPAGATRVSYALLRDGDIAPGTFRDDTIEAIGARQRARLANVARAQAGGRETR